MVVADEEASVIMSNSSGRIYAGGPIRCDRCGVKFVPQPQEESSPEGGIVTFFKCPNGDCFEIARIDAQGVELRRLIAEYGESSEGAFDDRLQRIRDMKVEFRQHIQRLMRLR